MFTKALWINGTKLTTEPVHVQGKEILGNINSSAHLEVEVQSTQCCGLGKVEPLLGSIG